MTQDEVIIIKIGGSSITNKATEETLNQHAIDWFAKLISASVHTSFLFRDKEEEEQEEENHATNEKRKTKPKFVVVHGAGSFGHHSAKRYGLQCGKAALLKGGSLSPPTTGDTDDDEKCKSNSSSSLQKRKRFQMEALSKTRHSVQKLNAAMVKSLLDQGVNACTISPGISLPGMRAYGRSCGSSSSSSTTTDTNAISGNDGSVAAMELLCQSINEALDAGLLPVVHGDACLCDCRASRSPTFRHPSSRSIPNFLNGNCSPAKRSHHTDLHARSNTHFAPMVQGRHNMQKERLVVCQKNDSSIVSFIVMSDASHLMVGSLVASVDTSFFLDSCSLPLWLFGLK
eukprot:scaffold11304_cov135-Skeletonema_menzelii.AAC.5